jgi:hypothetical protein
MAKNPYVAKVRELDEKHPGLRRHLNRLIGAGKGVHWISGFIHHHYSVRLKEDFIARYANFRNIFADGLADDAPTEEVSETPDSPPANSEAKSVGGAGSDRHTGKDAKATSSRSVLPTPEVVTKAEIIRVLKIKVARMLQRAAADPNSDAAQLMSILLLNEIANEKLGFKEKDFGKLVEAERKYTELANKLECERIRRKQIENKLRNQKTRLTETMQNVKDASAQGKALNHQEIFKQISAVIGVGQPQMERVRPL